MDERNFDELILAETNLRAGSFQTSEFSETSKVLCLAETNIVQEGSFFTGRPRSIVAKDFPAIIEFPDNITKSLITRAAK